MKKFFKEINLLKLMGIVLGIIECGLMTTFLILCRGWIKEDNLSLIAYVVICIFNIVISGRLIYMIGLLIWELIENKKK